MPKTLVILTGHSKGLGKALLDDFLGREEYQVLAFSRTLTQLAHPRLKEFALDLGDLDVLENKLQELFPKDEFEQIFLINNAGTIGEIRPIGKLGVVKLRNQVNINLLAPMYLTNAFISAYTGTPSKKVVCNISSGAASKPMEGWGGYCSTKAALAMYTKVAEKEQTDNPEFKFFSLAPGIVDTPMQGDIRSSDAADFPALDKFIEYKESGALSSPEEVARKIIYLLENEQDFEEVVQDVRNFSID